jgi:uncharacterized surface protein with fasciclin (FAS1) repeats
MDMKIINFARFPFTLSLTFVGLLSLSGPAATAQCGGGSGSDKSAAAYSGGNAMIVDGVDRLDIVDTAVSAGSFKTLVAAVKAAGLAGALKGEGPFTVFAPTDEAFAKLPEGTLETLLEPKNKKKLQAILTYHVVPAKVLASDVVKVSGATSLNGQRIDVQVSKKGVKVDSARVLKTDILCANGVIHVIDRVILPSSDDIVKTAAQASAFKTLVSAVKAAGLVEALQGKGPFTVLAPTNSAFAKLPEGTLQSLLQPENREKLQAILKFHVIPGRIYSTDALRAGHAKTLQGGKVNFSLRDGQAFVNGARIIRTDLDASNGVIHIIDSVILPE